MVKTSKIWDVTCPSERLRITLRYLTTGDAQVTIANTVEPVYSGHLRFLEKVSAITRCPLYRGFQYVM